MAAVEDMRLAVDGYKNFQDVVVCPSPHIAVPACIGDYEKVSVLCVNDVFEVGVGKKFAVDEDLAGDFKLFRNFRG